MSRAVKPAVDAPDSHGDTFLILPQNGRLFVYSRPVCSQGVNYAALAAGKFPIERHAPRALSLLAQAELCFLLDALNGRRLPLQG